MPSLTYLISGIVLGLTAGLTPGPTMALVLDHSVRYGAREGLKVAVAPLLTDVPIILLALLLLRRIDRVEPLAGAVALAGAVFLGYLALESFRQGPAQAAATAGRPRSILKGVLANALNPHPYLFWFTIGAPLLLEATASGGGYAALFVAALYVCMVGAKTTLALLAARGRSFLGSRAHLITLRALACGLLLFALMFLRDGLRALMHLAP